MKIWYQYGSEHSANLVMIGHFTDAMEAIKANEIINELTKRVSEEQDAGAIVLGRSSGRYSRGILDLLGQLNIMSIGPWEIEQFLYDVNVNVEGSKIIITSDETDVTAYLKILFDRGARIEVYSAHSHPDTEFGRGQ